MKKVRLSFTMGIVLFLLIGGERSLLSQNKEEKRIQLEAVVKEMVGDKHFIIEMNRAE